MNSSTPSARGEITDLDTGLQLVQSWSPKGVQLTDRLNQTEVRIEAKVEDFLEHLGEFLEAGHRAIFQVLHQNLTILRIDLTGKNSHVSREGSSLDDIFLDEPVLEKVRAAIDQENGSQLLKLCRVFQARVDLRVRNQSTRFHWLRTTQALHGALAELGWTGLLAQLFKNKQGPRLILHDAGDSYVQTSSFLIQGPDAPTSEPDSEADEQLLLQQAKRYQKIWLQDLRNQLPPPLALELVAHKDLDELLPGLRRITQALVWTWLATSARIAGREVILQFDGSVDVDLTEIPVGASPGKVTLPDDEESLNEALSLWRMAISTADHLRHEAVQKAFNLTIQSPEALYRGARRVHEMAKYLHRLAQQGAVAEALATLRAARQLATDTADAAAEGTRNASRAVIDRMFTQLAGTLGVLIALLGDVIGSAVAICILGAILVFTVLTALVSFQFEYPAARSALDNFERELSDRFGNLLPDSEACRIRDSQRLQSARDQLQRAERLSGLMLGGVGLFVILLLVVLLSS